MNMNLNRRQFLVSGALATGALALGGCVTKMPRKLATNEKLNIGIIGCGGKGWGDMEGVAAAGENIVALCDADEIVLKRAAKKYPKAKVYRDYRKMLDEVRELDAVTVSTPDHHHFPAAMRAIERGLHTYVQKPLTHSIWEARQLTLAARKHRVATQMGNQGTSGEGIRQLVEMLGAGALGQVREVHIWTDRPIWPQGKERPAGADPIPKHLDWDLWLGPAPVRPYKSKYPDVDRHVYHPFCWRGWWDFGTGALGDIGCHAMNHPMWALKLGAPLSAEVIETSGMVKNDAYPSWSIIRWDFPARGDLAPLKLFWYDGGKLPEKRPEMGNRGYSDNGQLYVGDKGVFCSGRLWPDALKNSFKQPAPTLPRIEKENHYQDWLIACRGGRPACSNFDFAGPLTETVLLGNIALRLGRKLEWDAKNLRIPGCPEADPLIRRAYRKGWA